MQVYITKLSHLRYKFFMGTIRSFNVEMEWGNTNR